MIVVTRCCVERRRVFAPTAGVRSQGQALRETGASWPIRATMAMIATEKHPHPIDPETSPTSAIQWLPPGVPPSKHFARVACRSQSMPAWLPRGIRWPIGRHDQWAKALCGTPLLPRNVDVLIDARKASICSACCNFEGSPQHRSSLHEGGLQRAEQVVGRKHHRRCCHDVLKRSKRRSCLNDLFRLRIVKRLGGVQCVDGRDIEHAQHHHPHCRVARFVLSLSTNDVRRCYAHIHIMCCVIGGDSNCSLTTSRGASSGSCLLLLEFPRAPRNTECRERQCSGCKNSPSGPVDTAISSKCIADQLIVPIHGASPRAVRKILRALSTARNLPASVLATQFAGDKNTLRSVSLDSMDESQHANRVIPNV